MNADCDNSGGNEASGRKDSAIVAGSKYRWLKWISILVAIIVAGRYWLNPPLNQKERELIGRWERITKSPDGAILKKVIKYDSNREWTLNIAGRLPSGDAGEMRVIKMNISGKWKLNGSKLPQSLDLPTDYRLHQIYYGLIDRVTGDNNVYNAIDEGRIRFVAPNKLHIQWYDPITETDGDFEESEWTRIE